MAYTTGLQALMALSIFARKRLTSARSFLGVVSLDMDQVSAPAFPRASKLFGGVWNAR